ncbi:hypothetical protein [Duncaniella freteri]|uniref:hypothetical protein n=1 Tax=Duncaniella freteri TaxID=2530391 RepID=UPI002587FFE1|nr:hypothetical protein [Duncaniella freteri]
MKGKDRELDIQFVDFSNVDEIWDFANRIIHAANGAGLFVTNGPLDKEQREIRIIAKDWVNLVEAAIVSMTRGDSLIVIYIFDIIHRIAYSTPADTAYIDSYRLDAFEAYIQGDKSIDIYVLFHSLLEEIGKRNRTYFGRPLEWVSKCVDRWYNNFITGMSAEAQSDYDIVHQVTALLCSDLWAYEKDQNLFKRKLVASHLDYITDKEAVVTDTGMQRALHALRFHASKYLPSII